MLSYSYGDRACWCPIVLPGSGCFCHQEFNPFLGGTPYCRGGNLVSLILMAVPPSSLSGCFHPPGDEHLSDLVPMSHAGENPEPSGLKKVNPVDAGVPASSRWR